MRVHRFVMRPPSKYIEVRQRGGREEGETEEGEGGR